MKGQDVGRGIKERKGIGKWKERVRTEGEERRKSRKGGGEKEKIRQEE